IVRRILLRNLDGHDPHLPLSSWWAVERHAVAATDRVLEAFASPAAWEAPLIREVILGRLMRRYAAEGTEPAYTACARLLASAPSTVEPGRLLAALDQGLQERPGGGRADNLGTLFQDLGVVRDPATKAEARGEKTPPALQKQLAALWTDDTTDVAMIRVLARLGHP